MTNLSQLNQYYNTADATAVAADIAAGKVAYGPDGKVVGISSGWNDGVTGNETLLLNFNGVDGGTTFTDDSSSGHIITGVGNSQLDTAIKKFGTASLLLDGSGDYLHTPYVPADFDWWTGPFTLDCWVYASSYNDWGYYSDDYKSSMIGNNAPTFTTNYWTFGPNTVGGLTFYYFNGAGNHVKSATGIMPLNVWNHIAVIHENSKITVYLNGLAVASATVVGTPQSNVSENLTIGAGNSAYITGSIDALRITKGTARFTDTFAVPTQEPSA